MTEHGDNQEPINAGPERGALARACADRVRYAIEDAGWLVRSRIAWPVEDAFERLGTRGAIGVFGGGGIATAGVIAAIVIASAGGSGSTGQGPVALAATPAPAVVAPAPRPKKKASKPTGPTMHGAPPSFAPAENVHSGVADGKALGGQKPGDAPSPSAASEAPAARASSAGAGDAPASTAKIGATPEASALATSRAGALDRTEASGPSGPSEQGAGNDGLSTTPAPRAAKRVARHFAEAFVAYEVGRVDPGVRKAFRATSTKQLSKSLLKRPPRQPADVKVPRAKVINVVAGPSQGRVYSVSVSLLRVGVTSELRLQMEQGVGKQWQVTNVLG